MSASFIFHFPRFVKLAGVLPGALLLSSFIGACSKPHLVLTHDAYIWQRQWSPEVKAAVHRSANQVQVWRVLAAYRDENSQAQLRAVAVDMATLRSNGKPVMMVIRLDGQLVNWDEARLLTEIEGHILRWQKQAVPLAGIEIDHDCATGRLPGYARFLAALRQRLNPSLSLSITALPAWNTARHLDTVLKEVDEVVLQVHAVQNPHEGLFEPARARRWIESFARRTDKPFRVALPNYGSKISWNKNNPEVWWIESETPLLASGSESRELFADPQTIAAFIQALQQDAPSHLKGISWFRLPVQGDQRIWSAATWHAVMNSQPVLPHLEVVMHPAAEQGLQWVTLVNTGEIDTTLPAQVRLDTSCRIADGANGYQLEEKSGEVLFRRAKEGLLPAQSQRVIGWIRCSADKVRINVQK